MKPSPLQNAHAGIRIALIAIFTLLAGTAGTHGQSIAARTDAPKGAVRNYTFTSALVRPRKHSTSRQIYVYTPPGYDDPANANVQYTVVYLLHGSPGNPTDFVKFGKWDRRVDQLINANKIVPFIWVAADGNYTDESHGDSEWVNSADGRDMYEDFVAKEIVAWTDQHFRTKASPQERVLCGVSEGGYASVNIALHRPDIFSMVIALSGYYTNDGSGWARPIMGHDQEFLSFNSPLEYVNKMPASNAAIVKELRFYLGAGEHEKPYTEETLAMSKVLTQDGAKVITNYLPGKHGWIVWTGLFLDALQQLMPKPAQPLATPPESAQ